MTKEEAIKYIEQHNHIDDVVKDMAIEALKKQVAIDKILKQIEEELEFSTHNYKEDETLYRKGIRYVRRLIKKEVQHE